MVIHPKKANHRNNNHRHPGGQIRIDDVDLTIIRELVNDSYASSSDMASKCGRPLSTVQRRRARLEKLFLQREYRIRPEQLSMRNAYIFIKVEGGNVAKLAEVLMRNPAVFSVTSGINSIVDLMVQVIYRDSEQVFKIMDKMRAMPNIKDVHWFEVVKLLGYNYDPILESLKIT